MDRLVTGLARQTCMALGITHATVLARLVDWEGNTPLAFDIRRSMAIRAMRNTWRQPIVTPISCGIVRYGSRTGGTCRQLQRLDINRWICRQYRYIDVTILVLAYHRAIVLQCNNCNVRNKAVHRPCLQDAGLAWGIFTLAVEYNLRIKVLGLQLVGSDTNGSSNFIQRFITDGRACLFKGIGQVVTLIEFARQLVVAVGAPQTLAALIVGDIGYIGLYPFPDGI